MERMKWRKVLKDDRMWFHPPEVPGVVGKTVPLADSFFWRPVGLPDMADSLSDSQHIERHVTKRDLSHYARRFTVRAQKVRHTERTGGNGCEPGPSVPGQ
ncbi:hypothetical protein D4764_19G0006060 [Takifugu flavidus]|uniref:Uncharacterized protein n=1 Tax=Takifugu flavidus TaxID=433684 RepID=A0A5C6NQ27_9TELE|nr:hypothetical protein D4764_19G0006060 [Takifugu flavidus]